MDTNRFVRPRALIRLLAWVAACAALPACNDDISGGDHINVVTARESLDKDDNQILDFGSGTPSISRDGMKIAFSSSSNQIVPGVPSTVSPVPSNVFVKDRRSRVPVKASVKSDAGATVTFAGGFGSNAASLSPDGTAVCFLSSSKLANGLATPTGTPNAYVRDLLNNVTKPVIDPDIWPSTGVQSNSVTVITTPTERYALVAFATASNLGNGTPPATQVYVSKVMLSANAIPVLTLVSRDNTLSAGPATGNCIDARISEDGSTVAFASSATNLDAAKADTVADIFVGTPAGDPVTVISFNAAGFKSNGGCLRPSLSADGRFVIFFSDALNMVPSGPNPGNIFRRDRGTGSILPSTDLVSVDSTGTQANLLCFIARVSGDGSKVVFNTNATNLLPGTTSGFLQVYVRDYSTGSLSIASVQRNGALAELDCNGPDISADGNFVTWSTTSSNLVAGDTNGIGDVFVRGPTQ